DFIDLNMICLLVWRAAYAFQPRANAAAVRFRANGSDLDPVVRQAGIAPQKLGKIVDRIDHHINVAVVVKIAESATPGSGWHVDSASGALGNIFETPVAHVAIENLALRVSRLGFQLLDLRINVPVTQQDVGPAVVIHIEETAAPAQVLGVQAESRGKSCVFEIRIPTVTVKRRSIAGEIGFDDVEVSVEVVVGGRNAHPGLWFSVRAQNTSGFDAYIFELSVLLVLIESAGGGIVGHIDVRPAIVVVISG